LLHILVLESLREVNLQCMGISARVKGRSPANIRCGRAKTLISCMMKGLIILKNLLKKSIYFNFLFCMVLLRLRLAGKKQD